MGVHKKVYFALTFGVLLWGVVTVMIIRIRLITVYLLAFIWITIYICIQADVVSLPVNKALYILTYI